MSWNHLQDGDSQQDANEVLKKSLKDPQYTAEGVEHMAVLKEANRFEENLLAEQENALNNVNDPAPDSNTLNELDTAGYTEAPSAVQREIEALSSFSEQQGITPATTQTVAQTAESDAAGQSSKDFYDDYEESLATFNSAESGYAGGGGWDADGQSAGENWGDDAEQAGRGDSGPSAGNENAAGKPTATPRPEWPPGFSRVAVKTKLLKGDFTGATSPDLVEAFIDMALEIHEALDKQETQAPGSLNKVDAAVLAKLNSYGENLEQSLQSALENGLVESKEAPAPPESNQVAQAPPEEIAGEKVAADPRTGLKVLETPSTDALPKGTKLGNGFYRAMNRAIAFLTQSATTVNKDSDIDKVRPLVDVRNFLSLRGQKDLDIDGVFPWCGTQ